MMRTMILLGGLLILGGAMAVWSTAASQGEGQKQAPARGVVAETIDGAVRARFYEPAADGAVRCTLCFHACVIPPGGAGICRVRTNRQGHLYTLVYGRPAGLQSDPIEMEPMYHMIPGHRNLGVFTASCNFRCKQCHNWHISQRGPDEVRALRYTPEEVVAEAIRRQSRSISHTINEPTIFFEYMYDISVRAREKGLLTLFHSNGAIASEPLRAILRHMDGVVIDLKAFCDTVYREVYGGRLAPVLETLKIIREQGVWLEIVNLVIPTVNDDMGKIKEMSDWIVRHLGPDVPLHFTRFQPSFQLSHLSPTPVATLEQAHAIAKAAGIRFVTIGNVPGHRYASTYCPEPACAKKLIHRTGSAILANHVKDGKCGFCGLALPGIWE